MKRITLPDGNIHFNFLSVRSTINHSAIHGRVTPYR